MRDHDDQEGGRDRDERQDRGQPVDGREDDAGRGKARGRGELDVDGGTLRDADAELAEARLDGVEGGPQEVGTVDDERVVLDPDRAVGVVEADQRVVRGLDEPQARGRDPGMVEGRLDARFEAPDDRRGGSVRRLAGERGEDQAAALVGVDERVEHRRGELLREVLAGFGSIERAVHGLGEGRAIHDAPARPGRSVGRGDGRDEGEHEQGRQEGSEHRRSLAGRPARAFRRVDHIERIRRLTPRLPSIAFDHSECSSIRVGRARSRSVCASGRTLGPKGRVARICSTTPNVATAADYGVWGISTRHLSETVAVRTIDAYVSVQRAHSVQESSPSQGGTHRMLDQQPTVVSLTDAAASKLQELTKEETNPDIGLRVYVYSGGCSGFRYGMMLEDAPTPEDNVLDANGIKVYVDGQSIDLLQGSQIDYVDTLMGAGFTVNNPNAVAACGCGSSFRTADDAGTARSCAH